MYHEKYKLNTDRLKFHSFSYECPIQMCPILLDPELIEIDVVNGTLYMTFNCTCGETHEIEYTPKSENY